MASAEHRERPPSQLAVKEGFLNKKGGILKSWRRRFFMLNRQSLVYFRREQESSSNHKLSPLGRIFLSDIVNIDKAGIETRKSFVFVLHTKKHAIYLQAFGEEEMDGWVSAIHGAMKLEGEAERKDPFRKTLRKLAPGLKRVTLMKDPEKGIGCTIKNAAGHIFVNRIIEDGPIACTGVLRPDDELLDVNGVTITGMTVAEVGQVIHACPDEFLATVRPITALKRIRPPDTTRVNYVTVLPILGTTGTNSEEGPKRSAMRGELSSPCDSLEDVSNYDDDDDYDYDDEGSPPPPIPKQTEDIHVLITATPATNTSMIPQESSRATGLASGMRAKRPHTYEEIKTNYMDTEVIHKT